MENKKLSQTQIILALLIQKYDNAFDDDKNANLMAPHHFMGEWYIDGLGWYFVSYEASARLSELNSGYPGLLEREWITGPSGARYMGYQIKDFLALVGDDPRTKRLVEITKYMLQDDRPEISR